MQHLAISKNLEKTSKKRLTTKVLLTVVLPVASVGLALVGIFTMSSWAEAAAWHHAAQHVVIFLSGVGFGSSVITGYLSKYGGNK